MRILWPSVALPRRRSGALLAVVLASAAAAGAAGGSLLWRPPARVALIPMPVAAAAPAPLLAMSHVVHEGGLRVVLSESVPPDWIAGPATVVPADLMVVLRPLSTAGRAQLDAYLGATLRLYGAAGPVCVARVTGAVALARHAGDHEEGDLPDPERLWTLGEPAHLLAGDLRVIEGDCSDATWARSASLPAPVLAEIRDAPRELREQAAAALRAHPDREALVIEGAATEVSVKEIATPAERLLVATLLAEGCGDPEPVLTLIFRLDQGELVPVGSGVVVAEILAAVDLEGDGRIELLVRPDVLAQSLLRRVGRAYVATSAIFVPIFGCRC